ncbi:DUF6328 family protein [Streptomyces sp. NPDC004050]
MPASPSRQDRHGALAGEPPCRRGGARRCPGRFSRAVSAAFQQSEAPVEDASHRSRSHVHLPRRPPGRDAGGCLGVREWGSASPPVPGVGLPGPGIRPSQPRHAGLTRPATHPAARGSAKSRPGRPLNERPLRPAPRNVGQRRETCDERADRLWLEMVYEVRVLLTAVQLLFAFFLPVACCAGRVRWRR